MNEIILNLKISDAIYAGIVKRDQINAFRCSRKGT